MSGNLGGNCPNQTDIFTDAERALPLGERLLAVLRPAVEAEVKFEERWGAIGTVKVSEPGFTTFAAGVPVDEIYTGLEHLQGDEILLLQQCMAQRELSPNEEQPIDPLELLWETKFDLTRNRNERWGSVYDAAFKGIAVEVRPIVGRNPWLARPSFDYLQDHSRGPEYDYMEEDDVVRGLLGGATIGGRGSLALLDGSYRHKGAEQLFTSAFVGNLFGALRHGQESESWRVAPAVEITTLPPPPGVAASDALAD